MKLLWVAFFWLIYFTGHSQQILEIRGSIKDIKGLPVPFASVYTSRNYGVVSDENGEFKIKLNKKDSLIFSCVGFKKITLFVSNSKEKQNIVLENLEQVLPELLVKKNQQLYTTSTKGKINKHTYNFEMSSSFSECIIIEDSNLQNKIIKSVKMKLGFRGNPILPFRLGIFSLDEQGRPKNTLLKKDIIFYPSRKFSMNKLDLEEHSIRVSDTKICFVLQLINKSTSPKKLDNNFTPIIGFWKIESQSGLFNSPVLNRWEKFGDSNPLIIVELSY